MQERGPDAGVCALEDIRVRDLVTGEAIAIMQNLGRDAVGCRVDAAAVALAALRLDAARAARPDLLVVSRFGRLESEGGGMRDEIGRAWADDVPLLVCVPRRHLDAWNAFAADLDVKLEPSLAAIEGWWEALSPSGCAAA